MKKGLSVWLFSKLVMFSFLVAIFAIMAQMMFILNDRAYIDSATLLVLQAKESAGAVFNSNTVEIEKAVPLPKALPEKTENSKNYYFVIKKNTPIGSGSSSISFAVTKGTYSKKIFSASAILYYSNAIDTNLGTSNELILSSLEYHYLLIKKQTDKVEFYGCQGLKLDSVNNNYYYKKCINSTGIITDRID